MAAGVEFPTLTFTNFTPAHQANMVWRCDAHSKLLIPARFLANWVLWFHQDAPANVGCERAHHDTTTIRPIYCLDRNAQMFGLRFAQIFRVSLKRTAARTVAGLQKMIFVHCRHIEICFNIFVFVSPRWPIGNRANVCPRHTRFEPRRFTFEAC